MTRLWAPTALLLLAAWSAAQGGRSAAAPVVEPVLPGARTVTPVPPLSLTPGGAIPTAAAPLPALAPLPQPALRAAVAAPAVAPLAAAAPEAVAAPAALALPQPAVPAAVNAAVPLIKEGPGQGPSGGPAPPASAEDDSAWAARLFDNAWVDRPAALARLGFDPGMATGRLMSDYDKRDWAEVLHAGRLVVKRFHSQGGASDARAAAKNEVLARAFADAPAFRGLFTPYFTMPRAVGLDGKGFLGLPFGRRKAFVVMEAVDARPIGSYKLHEERAWVPTRLRAPLFILAQTLGLGDLNANGLLVDAAGRYHLVDTEVGRMASRPNPGLLVPVDMPWVDNEHLGAPEDFAPAMAAFKAAFAKADADGTLKAILAQAGITGSEAQRDLATLRGNVEAMEAVLEADLRVGDRQFMSSARRAGLDDAQARWLSGLNKTLLALDRSEAQRAAQARRDLARWFYARRGGVPMGKWPLAAEELGVLVHDDTVRAELAAIARSKDSLPLRREAAADLLAALGGMR